MMLVSNWFLWRFFDKKNFEDIETKKSKAKTKKIEESTIDTDSVVSSPSLITPTQGNLDSPKSPVETTGFPSLSIPVPHIGGSSTHGLISPDLSRIHTPQQSNSKCLYSINLWRISFFI